jgi:hypothetical protein
LVKSTGTGYSAKLLSESNYFSALPYFSSLFLSEGSIYENHLTKSKINRHYKEVDCTVILILEYFHLFFSKVCPDHHDKLPDDLHQLQHFSSTAKYYKTSSAAIITRTSYTPPI